VAAQPLLAPLAVAAEARQPVGGASALVNPYSGAIALVSPLAGGTYQPLSDNWHQSREGQLYTWSHRDAKTQRAHDGVDLFPQSAGALPQVFAPLAGTVAAVCLRSDNTLGATVTYKVSATTPPPWDYSQAVDNVAGLPLYGNFVWLRSAAPDSAGYFVFYCHLQNEATLQGLAPDQAVGTSTQVGVMGDTGNAAGAPQLHVEIHYPAGQSFTCSRCKPRKAGVTAIDPYQSLLNAAPR
jgi:murein DD-endopeptidase MepM/ murein hydrolase activator NlpD